MDSVTPVRLLITVFLRSKELGKMNLKNLNLVGRNPIWVCYITFFSVQSSEVTTDLCRSHGYLLLSSNSALFE